jgi:hypothetical protein
MSDVEAERRPKADGGSDQASSQSETERAIVRTVTEVGPLWGLLGGSVVGSVRWVH